VSRRSLLPAGNKIISGGEESSAWRVPRSCATSGHGLGKKDRREKRSRRKKIERKKIERKKGKKIEGKKDRKKKDREKKDRREKRSNFLQDLLTFLLFLCFKSVKWFCGVDSTKSI
jgi:hypothetical protein